MTGEAPSIVDGLRQAARTRPHVAATLLPDGRSGRGTAGYRATTFAQLDARSDAIAAGLRACGIADGARAALLVPPTGDFFALSFGLLKAGAVPVLIDPGIGTANLGRCLRDAAPDAFIGVPRAQAARLALRWCPQTRLAVTVGPPLPGAGLSLRRLEADGRSRLPVRAHLRPGDATAAVLFTSGTTGPPKGVRYRHPHFAAQVRLLRALYDLGPADTAVVTFPPFALFGPALGMTVVVPRMDPTRPARVDPRQVLEAANAFRATTLFGSPALLRTVGRWGAQQRGRMTTVRTVLSAGAPVSADVVKAILAMLGEGARVATPYGATEALPVTSITSDELPARGTAGLGVCVGSPAPGLDVAVMGIDDGPVARLDPALRVADGDVGEVVVRGPNVTESYFRRPEADALAKIDWDGRVAHRMGDLGSIDDRGRLWFAGRKVDRVVTATGTLYTVACEEVFNVHPAVIRSALVGVGPRGSARPVLCVELEPEHRPTPALTAQLRALGAAHPHTRQITAFRYHPGLPVDIRHNSKIDYPALARWAAPS